MADLIEEQKDTIRRISRVVENLKKTGAAKITEGAVRARLDALEDMWSDLKTTHRSIVKAAKETTILKADVYFSKDLFDQAEGSYLEQRGLLLDILKPVGQSLPVGGTSSNVTVASAESRSRAVLPRIPLPEFDGRYCDWPSFRDLFVSLIVKDSSLSEVDRLHYLKTCLKGEAAGHLKNYTTTEDNFALAWQALQDRYQNKRKLVRSQLTTLTSLAPVTKESAAELKRLLYDTVGVVGALNKLGRPITNATDWLVHITVERLDRQSRREWESSLGTSDEVPTFDELKEFLAKRIDTVEALEGQRDSGQSETKKINAKGVRVHQVSASSNPAKDCSLCKGKHYVAFCPTYQKKSPAERQAVTESLHLCVNCLGKHHFDACQSTKKCRICDEKHHTSLHAVYRAIEQPTVHHAALQGFHSDRVILSTARVKLLDPSRPAEHVRALIDPASEVSIIAEALVQRLGLRRRGARIPLLGVGGARSRSTRGYTTVTIASHCNSGCRHEVSALILPELSGYVPRKFPEERTWHHLQGLLLADPWFQRNDAVELLLGADVYNKILRCGVRLGGPNAPVAQETCLGWVLNGGIKDDPSHADPSSGSPSVHHCAVDKELVSVLNKFWEQEEISVVVPPTPENEECERHFLRTYLRDDEGRFVVSLPFKTPPSLGDSRRAALGTLEAMQRKFRQSSKLQEAYEDFMSEYESAGHMVRVPNSGESLTRGADFYLPHHGVWKDSSTTTKLRVVFNGSLKTDNGRSLNEFLHTGQNLLPPLAEVLLRWRKHAVAFTADVAKMYRQIRVREDDWRWQKILWRRHTGEAPQEYHLCTVTYGLACAPYLAIRCIHQLATEEAEKFPEAAKVIRRDVYMDDVLSGGSTLAEAQQLQRELYELLMAGGFPLRKWASNSRELLNDIASSDAEAPRSWTTSESHSVLGIEWLPSSDCFQVTTTDTSDAATATKRTVLSKTAQLFDPLGWLAPVTIVAKILIQELWLLKSDWDTPLPAREEQHWSQFVRELPSLAGIQIPRWLGWLPSSSIVEVHGFADASERAYAAVIYLRVVDAAGNPRATLITAKSKVAPLKQVSIPRLELCAAWLLTRLAAHVLTVLELEDVDAHLWSDSIVTLGWIRGHPTKWSTYVANRVSSIQQKLPLATWHHVPGADNPADCASRGLSPGHLAEFSLWWTGPSWLNYPDRWPRTEATVQETTLEQRTRSFHTQLPGEDQVSLYISRFSKLRRLFRVTAWCWRWLPKYKGTRSAHLTSDEIHAVRRRLVLLVQRQAFPKEINNLQNKQAISIKSRLQKLSPFLDEEGLLRVGGRLQGAALPYDRTHPLILPDDSPLAVLWVRAAHLRCLHGGVQLTLATLRQECWILRGRPMVKSCLRECVICFRWKHQPPVQLMGNLPRARVVPCRPFIRAGVDYAGPIQVRAGRGRGQKSVKGYIALFICLSTRAVHLELVSDGSSETFLAALRRFVARRGVCSEIYSDCGTNFVGANRELRSLLRAALLDGRDLLTTIAAEGIRWKFNPPAAPHFGGLWEAAVKSVKHHLRRQIGEQKLTFEELSTLLAGIEACLNSRPLEPLSDDPEDLQALTPGHFLIGGPLIAIPEPSLEELQTSRLSRWQLVQQVQQHFWRRWSKEYLNTLQTRGKWCQVQPTLQRGTLCLLKQELLPPTRWPLARITSVYPGPDGLTRVVTVKTAKAEFTRPINKVIPLPTPSGSSLDAARSYD